MVSFPASAATKDALPYLRTGARSDVRARYNLGVTLYNLGRYDEAIRELEVLVRNHPMREEAPWAHRVIGHAYARLQRWTDAVAHLRTALSMTPGDTDARRLLVDSYNLRRRACRGATFRRSHG